MTKLTVLLSRTLALLLNHSPLHKWAVSRSNFALTSWLKSLAAIYSIDRLVSLDLAWWPFKVMKFIEKNFSKKHVSVFEWGSGASTIWMAKRGYQVISVEHDERWAQAVKLKSEELNVAFISTVKVPRLTTSPHVRSQKKGYEGLDFQEYVAEIHKHGLFDLIVIDGRARVDCLIAARSHLKKEGIILFDNSNRKRYRDEIEKDMDEVIVKGLTPASPFSTQSSILGIS
jgi:hypothetical protein